MSQARPDPQTQNIRAASTRDVVAERDSLGFQPYVTALARFLTNQRTAPPLTVSIEGKWGSGKSSFMSQLESAVVRLSNADNMPIIVKFNPWKHEEQESLWSSFALQYIRQISKSGTWLSRFGGHVKLFLQRFDWKKGWLELLRLVTFAATVVIIVVIPIVAIFWDGTG